MPIIYFQFQVQVACISSLNFRAHLRLLPLAVPMLLVVAALRGRTTIPLAARKRFEYDSSYQASARGRSASFIAQLHQTNSQVRRGARSSVHLRDLVPVQCRHWFATIDTEACTSSCILNYCRTWTDSDSKFEHLHAVSSSWYCSQL